MKIEKVHFKKYPASNFLIFCLHVYEISRVFSSWESKNFKWIPCFQFKLILFTSEFQFSDVRSCEKWLLSVCLTLLSTKFYFFLLESTTIMCCYFYKALYEANMHLQMAYAVHCTKQLWDNLCQAILLQCNDCCHCNCPRDTKSTCFWSIASAVTRWGKKSLLDYHNYSTYDLWN